MQLPFTSMVVLPLVTLGFRLCSFEFTDSGDIISEKLKSVYYKLVNITERLFILHCFQACRDQDGASRTTESVPT